jgi:uncharacterized membrane protein
LGGIIDLISNIVNISGNPVVDAILFSIIGLISFSVAFGMVGSIFDSLGFYDSDLMSDTHWLIRVVVFVSLTWIFVEIFQFISWLLSFQWWVYVIIFVVVILVVLLLFYIKYKIRLKANTKNIEYVKIEATEKKTHTTAETIVKYDKYRCPRCGSKLVKRHGPYGDFVGCSSYPNCRYTRSKF